MILAAYCLGEEAKSGIDHVDVPPIMIDVPGGGGYDFVRRKIVEGLQGYRGKHEAIYVKTMRHGGSDVSPSSGPCDFYGFFGEPVLFTFYRVCHLSEKARDMSINVQTQEGHLVALSVDATDSIREVLYMFQRKADFLLLPECHLFLGDERLSLIGDSAKVSDYNIQEGSTLRWARVSRHPFTLRIRTLWGKVIEVDAHISDTGRDIRQRIEEKEGIPVRQQRLIFQRTEVADDVDDAFCITIADYGIREGSQCMLGLTFDYETPRDEKTIFTEEGQSWRSATPGLCLEGLCKNHACIAHGKMVVLNNGFDDFDLKRAENRPCPECKSDITPTTCAFNNCTWRYVGKKEGERSIRKKPWTDVGHNYHRFDESPEAGWERLLVQARPVLEGVEDSNPSVSVATDYTWRECTICTQSGNGNMKVLQCGHLFHKPCIARRADGSDVVCPNCRQTSRGCDFGADER